MSRDNEAIRAELEQLKTAGVIRPADVVSRAADPESAMHSWFEWDDGEAAQAYRLQQARQLLRVFVTVQAKDSSPVRAFVSLGSDRYGEGGYRALAEVLSDEQMRAQLLADAIKELRTSEKKYRQLQELSGVWSALDDVQKLDAMKPAA
ncbi:hypothetical protein [Stenotrophomonas maltophilia]|uniref:hypothetical protein n=1 Tax=Stenotrophomonas maltophilia TaxID=40324 RepID=UPI000F66A4A6|nr:hypothetical protein [Stenotrophomonas maltophilia]RRU74158.1 hypothetical protein EGJ89_07515 [Stenotrophomonas maltophilia]